MKYQFEKFKNKRSKSKPKYDGPKIRGITKDPDKIDYTRLVQQEGLDLDELEDRLDQS